MRDLSVKCPLMWKSASNLHTPSCRQKIVVLDVQVIGFAPDGLGVANLCLQRGGVVKTSSSVALPREHASQ